MGCSTTGLGLVGGVSGHTPLFLWHVTAIVIAGLCYMVSKTRRFDYF